MVKRENLTELLMGFLSSAFLYCQVAGNVTKKETRVIAFPQVPNGLESAMKLRER
jgi:hypothetical protein